MLNVLQKYLIRLTGRPQIPNASYIREKAYKYAFQVPPTWCRAQWRGLRRYLPSIDGKRLLFVGGLHGSGTSILYKVLQQHPDISGINGTTVPEDEGQHLQSVFPPDSDYGLHFADAADYHLTETSDLVSDENRDALTRSWARYWDFRKPVLLEKSPSNILRSRMLQAMYPESSFLFITRHPADYAYRLEKWYDGPRDASVRHWCRAHDLLMGDLAHLKHHKVIRYEDMVRQPAKTFGGIWEFLDLAPPAGNLAGRIDDGRYHAFWNRKGPAIVSEVGEMGTDMRQIIDAFGYGLEAPFVRDHD